MIIPFTVKLKREFKLNKTKTALKSWQQRAKDFLNCSICLFISDKVKHTSLK